MEKVQVVVTSSSGSTEVKGELYSSGVIHYADDSYSHISAEVTAGKKVSKYVEPEVKKPEPKVEIKKVEVATSPVQTAPTKKKKVKG